MTTAPAGNNMATWARIATRIAVLAAILLLYQGVDTGSLVPSDDSVYTRAAIEGARAGRLIDVTWMGHVLFEKGPLLFGAIQLSGLPGGPVEQQARFPGIVAAVLLLLLIYRVARDLGLSVPAAMVAAAFCLSTNLFYFNARRPMTDIPGLMLAVAGLRTFLVSGSRTKHVVSGLLFGLSSLFKLTAPLPFMAAVVVFRLVRDRNGGRRAFADVAKGLGWCLAGMMVALLPWHVAMIAVHGQAFIDTYFGYHLFQRLSQSVEGLGAAETYIGWMMTRDAAASIVLCIVVPIGLVLAVKKDMAAVAAFIMILFAAAMPAASSTALPHYIVPILPGVALLVGVCADRLFGLAGNRANARTVALVAALAATGAMFLSSNFDDMRHPDYSHDSKTMCRTMLADGSAAHVAGTFDLHDTSIPLYCDTRMKFFGYHPDYHAAVYDTPMLSGTYERFKSSTAAYLADTGATLVCDENGLVELKDIAEKSGMDAKVRDFGSRFVFAFVRR